MLQQALREITTKSLPAAFAEMIDPVMQNTASLGSSMLRQIAALAPRASEVQAAMLALPEVVQVLSSYIDLTTGTVIPFAYDESTGGVGLLEVPKQRGGMGCFGRSCSPSWTAGGLPCVLSCSSGPTHFVNGAGDMMPSHGASTPMLQGPVNDVTGKPAGDGEYVSNVNWMLDNGAWTMHPPALDANGNPEAVTSDCLAMMSFCSTFGIPPAPHYESQLQLMYAGVSVMGSLLGTAAPAAAPAAPAAAPTPMAAPAVAPIPAAAPTPQINTVVQSNHAAAQMAQDSGIMDGMPEFDGPINDASVPNAVGPAPIPSAAMPHAADAGAQVGAAPEVPSQDDINTTMADWLVSSGVATKTTVDGVLIRADEAAITGHKVLKKLGALGVSRGLLEAKTFTVLHNTWQDFLQHLAETNDVDIVAKAKRLAGFATFKKEFQFGPKDNDAALASFLKPQLDADGVPLYINAAGAATFVPPAPDQPTAVVPELPVSAPPVVTQPMEPDLAASAVPGITVPSPASDVSLAHNVPDEVATNPHLVPTLVDTPKTNLEDVACQTEIISQILSAHVQAMNSMAESIRMIVEPLSEMMAEAFKLMAEAAKGVNSMDVVEATITKKKASKKKASKKKASKKKASKKKASKKKASKKKIGSRKSKATTGSATSETESL